MKYRFVIVGSGWRSFSYVRVAKALPDNFELCAMLCRTQEKAERIASEHNIYTTTSIDECRDMKPDFVVVAVNKAAISQVSEEWLNYGFTVLCETPASLKLEELHKLWQLHKEGKRLVVAEQYIHYPLYRAIESSVSHFIGSCDCVNISLAHEYHGASLIRAFLHEGISSLFTVEARTYEFPTVETMNRYEEFKDGRIADKKRTVAIFEFEDKKVALYDFDSEQYRSPIRKNFLKLQGSIGELINNKIYYLDEKYEAQEAELIVNERTLTTDSDNPNLRKVRETESIVLKSTSEESRVVYEPEFGLCGLKDDEAALAHLMVKAGEYANASKTWDWYQENGREREQKAFEMVRNMNLSEKAFKSEINRPDYDENMNFINDVSSAVGINKRMDMALRNALQDSYMAILMQQAVETGKKISGERQPWQV